MKYHQNKNVPAPIKRNANSKVIAVSVPLLIITIMLENLLKNTLQIANQ